MGVVVEKLPRRHQSLFSDRPRFFKSGVGQLHPVELGEQAELPRESAVAPPPQPRDDRQDVSATANHPVAGPLGPSESNPLNKGGYSSLRRVCVRQPYLRRS